MNATMQNGSGPTSDSQDDDEVRIKSLSELKSLWEGMASKSDRSGNPEGQVRKPQLVRGDRPRQAETAGMQRTASIETVSGTMTTPPTRSVAKTTISLVAPSTSTTKVKCSVSKPTTVVVSKAPMGSSATASRSSMTMAVMPMTTRTSSLATNAISTTTPKSYMTKPAIYTVTPSSPQTTASTSSRAGTTTSTASTSGFLQNDGKNSIHPIMTSREPGKGDGRFESQVEATGQDQAPRNRDSSVEPMDQLARQLAKQTQIKTTSPTDAPRISPEATFTFVAPTAGDDGNNDCSPPLVVRGSILVRNSFDMIGWPPRLLDVIENSDSDEGIVVEENTNLFHGRYFQLRENPLYFSDHEDQEEEEEEQDRGDDRSQKQAKQRKYLRNAVDGGPALKAVSTQKMENPRPLFSPNQKDKDAASSNDDGSSNRSSLPFAADRTVKVDGPNRSQILRLVDDGCDGARQTVTVERTEEELTKEMMEALQVSGDPSKGVTNVDVVEERLDVELSNGLAQVKVTVHCERIVPNRMSAGQSYRKSSVTVTRMTEVDMLATPERRRIYERVVDRYGTPEEETAASSHKTALVPRNRLSSDDVYALYRVFVEVTGGLSMSLAEDPGNQVMANLSKSEVAGLELLSGQSLPLSLLRLGPLISPVSLTQP